LGYFLGRVAPANALELEAVQSRYSVAMRRSVNGYAGV
jgi:hypothetical protein